METNKVNYGPDKYRRHFSDQYVVDHTIIPQKDMPLIIGWSGPARSGTTALLYLLASSPEVDRAYFQPQKTLMRLGHPDFRFFAEDRVVCMKEVFGGDGGDLSATHDPIDLLLRAGIPKEKIIWITTLREPVQAFSSFFRCEPRMTPSIYTPSIYAMAQAWSLELFHKYRGKIKMIPFAYELAAHNEAKVLAVLFEKLGLEFSTNLRFDRSAIKKKIVPGQLSDQKYYAMIIKDTLDRDKYVYSKNNYNLPLAHKKEIVELCSKDYEDFYKLAKIDLGL